MESADDAVQCLVSHTCGKKTHAFVGWLKEALAPLSVVLHRDPFEPGDAIATKIQTLQTIPIEILLYLSRGPVISNWCRRELLVARSRSIAIITVRLEGAVPMELRNRICVDCRTMSGEDSDAMVQQLASAILVRANLYQDWVHLISVPEESRAAAKRLALEYEKSVLAESVYEIGWRYHEVQDPTTRYWLALAIGQCQTVAAARVLASFLGEAHPYPRQGIEEAFRMVPRSAAIAALRHRGNAAQPQGAPFAAALLQTLTRGEGRMDHAPSNP